MNIENLSLERTKQLKQYFDSKPENALAQMYLQNRFFFLKDKKREEYQSRVLVRLAILINEIYSIGIYDVDVYDFCLIKMARNTTISGDAKQTKLNMLYFYNESIPREYANNIFSYKRCHKKENICNDKVKNYILEIAKDYRNYRLTLQENVRKK